ncbi:hypothetical protein K8I31_16890 [bacterium]|nr:hypothetical protein [bacterium]
MYVFVECLMLWHLCGGLHFLASKADNFFLMSTALFRRKFYVVTHAALLIFISFIQYVLALPVFNNPNYLILVVPVLMPFLTLVLLVMVSFYLVVLLFRQAGLIGHHPAPMQSIK